MIGWDTGLGGGWMVFGGWLMMLFFWGALAALIVLVIRVVQGDNGDAGSRQNGGSNQSPIEILKRRYASGEIDDQEYENIRHQFQAF